MFGVLEARRLVISDYAPGLLQMPYWAARGTWS